MTLAARDTETLLVEGRESGASSTRRRQRGHGGASWTPARSGLFSLQFFRLTLDPTRPDLCCAAVPPCTSSRCRAAAGFISPSTPPECSRRGDVPCRLSRSAFDASGNLYYLSQA